MTSTLDPPPKQGDGPMIHGQPCCLKHTGVGRRDLLSGGGGQPATRTDLTVRDFHAIHQDVAVFDLLGMVGGTGRARVLPPPDELHILDGRRCESTRHKESVSARARVWQ